MSAVAIEATRFVDAQPAKVWAVVGDPNGYHRYVADLAVTQVVGGEGLGMRRQCSNDAGQAWEEDCTLWEPGHRYRFSVDVSTYPRSLRAMFSAFQGTWTVEPEGAGSRIRLLFEGETRLGLVGKSLVSAMARNAGLEEILDAYEAEVLGSD